ncbi:unnamed protein product [Brassica oleracea]
MYSITGFDVARCNPNFRLSDSSLLVQFSDAISLNEFTEPISPIPEECFRFRSQGELFGLANTNTQLPGKLPFTPNVCILSSPDTGTGTGNGYGNRNGKRQNQKFKVRVRLGYGDKILICITRLNHFLINMHWDFQKGVIHSEYIHIIYKSQVKTK